VQQAKIQRFTYVRKSLTGSAIARQAVKDRHLKKIKGNLMSKVQHSAPAARHPR